MKFSSYLYVRDYNIIFILYDYGISLRINNNILYWAMKYVFVFRVQRVFLYFRLKKKKKPIVSTPSYEADKKRKKYGKPIIEYENRSGRKIFYIKLKK